MLTFTPIPETVCTIGESPTWDAERNALLWCDIPAGKIFELAVDAGEIGSGARRSWSFDGPVGGFGLAGGDGLIVACGRSLYRLDRDSGAISLFARVEEEDAPTRLNDGKVGPDGAFWIGSMDDTATKQPIGALYRVTADGAVERKLSGVTISNGLAWSADGTRLFHADSRGPTIDRWSFDAATGTINGRQRVATLDDTTGRPDGGATDQAGTYWSAGVSAARLNLFDPEGEATGYHVFPTSAPTMPCFGGDDLRTLFVTSLRRGGATAIEGSVFVTRVEVPGVPIQRFSF